MAMGLGFLVQGMRGGAVGETFAAFLVVERSWERGKGLGEITEPKRRHGNEVDSEGQLNSAAPYNAQAWLPISRDWTWCVRIEAGTLRTGFGIQGASKCKVSLPEARHHCPELSRSQPVPLGPLLADQFFSADHGEPLGLCGSDNIARIGAVDLNDCSHMWRWRSLSSNTSFSSHGSSLRRRRSASLDWMICGMGSLME